MSPKADPEQTLRAVLDRAVETDVFPGAQLCVVGPGTNLTIAVGSTAGVEHEQRTPVSDQTWFDVASLTKVLCTSVLLMHAVERGRLSLSDSVSKFFPALPSARSTTIAHLASHRSGLIAHHRFFSAIWRERIPAGPPARERLFEDLCKFSLLGSPGSTTMYSDPGFLLLGWILERVLDEDLDRAFRRIVTAPLGLERLRFGPVTPPVAATEPDENGAMLWGVVHDENARALGGIEGHAGLFGNAGDTMAVVRHLEEVRKGGSGVVRSGTVREFWKPRGGERFTLGWDTPTEPSSSGQFTTRGAAVGHLGFTGCSLWHDIARDVTVVLLSNRVHPSRENDRLRPFRPHIHDVINQQIFMCS